MTRVALLVAIAFALAGCGESGRLKGEVKAAMPPDAQQVHGCDRSDLGADGPPNWSCRAIVRGTERSVMAAMAKRLRMRGFTVGCADISKVVPGNGSAVLVAIKAPVELYLNVDSASDSGPGPHFAKISLEADSIGWSPGATLGYENGTCPRR